MLAIDKTPILESSHQISLPVSENETGVVRF